MFRGQRNGKHEKFQLWNKSRNDDYFRESSGSRRGEVQFFAVRLGHAAKGLDWSPHEGGADIFM